MQTDFWVPPPSRRVLRAADQCYCNNHLGHRPLKKQKKLEEDEGRNEPRRRKIPTPIVVVTITALYSQGSRKKLGVDLCDLKWLFVVKVHLETRLAKGVLLGYIFSDAQPLTQVNYFMYEAQH